MKEKIEPCPFCGSTDINFIEAYDDEGLMRVACNACGYTSGMATSYNTATQEWENLCRRVAALRARADDYKAKWESVPLIQIADVVDHFRAGAKPDDVHGRLAMTIGFLMDHTDWSPAMDADKWRQWHERMHTPYKRPAYDTQQETSA